MDGKEHAGRLLKVVKLQDAILKARSMAERKLARNEDADEFLKIAEADGFRIYVAVGKTISQSAVEMHANPRDVFVLVLEGEIEFVFEKGEKTTVRAGECFVLPKHLMHACAFGRMTVAVEGVYEEGLQRKRGKKKGMV